MPPPLSAFRRRSTTIPKGRATDSFGLIVRWSVFVLFGGKITHNLLKKFGPYKFLSLFFSAL
jgi:hypothetical protein